MCLCRASLALVVELLAEHLKLPGLHLEEFGLLQGEFLLVGDLAFDGRDLLGLLEERLPRVHGGDHGEDGQDDGRNRRDPRGHFE